MTSSSQSSISSVHGSLAAEEIADCLVQDTVFRGLSAAAVAMWEGDKFERYLARSLGGFADALRAAATNPLQKGAAWLVTNKRKYIAMEVRRRLDPNTERRNREMEGLDHASSQQETKFQREERLRQYIAQHLADRTISYPERAEAEERIKDGQQATQQSIKDAIPDDLEPDALDEPEPESLPQLEQVREFLFQSAAFEQLKENFNKFLLPQERGKAKTPQDDGHGASSAAIIKSAKSPQLSRDTTLDVHKVERRPTSRTAALRRQNVGEYHPLLIGSANSALRSGEYGSGLGRGDYGRGESAKPLLLSQVPGEDAWCDDTSNAVGSLRLLAGEARSPSRLERGRGQVSHVVLGLLRPRLQKGYTRITWTCVSLTSYQPFRDIAHTSLRRFAGLWEEHVCGCSRAHSRLGTEAAVAVENVGCGCCADTRCRVIGIGHQRATFGQ